MTDSEVEKHLLNMRTVCAILAKSCRYDLWKLWI